MGTYYGGYILCLTAFIIRIVLLKIYHITDNHSLMHHYYRSIIGTPPQEVWPVESNISASQFGLYKPIPWELLLSECSHEAVDLLSVSIWIFYLNIISLIFLNTCLPLEDVEVCC